ncbi:hypothetical protein E4P39_00060 [Blastococcus sp. CT_GayMR19]|nr:hypothetical protein E4P39_00060 [Blastococcus sp. CT_GayMR19]
MAAHPTRGCDERSRQHRRHDRVRRPGRGAGRLGRREPADRAGRGAVRRRHHVGCGPEQDGVRWRGDPRLLA